MEIRKAERKQARIKIGLQGPSGAGKTFSALLLAYGLCSNWNKITILDTENNSADLYSDLGDYNVINITTPFSPEKYIQAIELCEQAGMEVIIVDSMSHCWDFLIDAHANMLGNSFTNWSKITPRQNNLVNKLLHSPIHVIATLRVKQEYVLNLKDGKHIPEKVGLKAVQRDGLDYEFTVVLDINIKHQATASKDRTNLFIDKPEFIITRETGKTILDWCHSGKENKQQLQDKITACESIDALRKLFHENPELPQDLIDAFNSKKNDLIKLTEVQNNLSLKFNTNGSFTNHK